MGLVLSFLTRCFRTLFGRKQPWNVVMVGPPSAGKTAILYKLKGGNEIVYMQHWMGIMMVQTLEYMRFFIQSWDIATHELLYRFYGYRTIFAESDALVFVVDAADTDYIETTNDVWKALMRAKSLAGVPVLVLATHADLASAMSVADMTRRLELDTAAAAAVEREWHVQPMSHGREDERVRDGFAWLERVLEAREREGRRWASRESRKER